MHGQEQTIQTEAISESIEPMVDRQALKLIQMIHELKTMEKVADERVNFIREQEARS